MTYHHNGVAYPNVRAWEARHNSMAAELDRIEAREDWVRKHRHSLMVVAVMLLVAIPGLILNSCVPSGVDPAYASVVVCKEHEVAL